MRKQWIGVCVAAGLLAACSSDNNNNQQTNTAPQPAVCNGPNVEITGADPRPEALSPTANQDYQRDGKQYRIVQDPANFSQSGLAAIDNGSGGARMTATGETYDAGQLTAAHPTLPIPSYARITNLANGRMIVVRINDRGPYGDERIIALSQAAADRLNTSNNTKVRVDPIIVAQDGTLSGPGTACTTIARQSYALPARPDLSGNSSGGQPSAQQNDVMAMSNSNQAPQQQQQQQQQNNAQPAPQGAQQPPAPNYQTATGEHNAPVTAPGSIQGGASTSGSYVVQVGAVSDGGRASQWQQQLSQQYSVPGRVSQNGQVWRIQLGPFATRGEAVEVQQRLLNAGQPQSFVTSAQ